MRTINAIIMQYLQTQYQFMVSEVLDDPELLQKHLIQGFQQGFHCVNLDLKDFTSAELF